MPTLPAGTVTFLFSDIEGSTRLLQRLGDRYAGVLARYQEILVQSAGTHAGHRIDTVGDAGFFVFSRVSDAVSAAVTVQRALTEQRWPAGEVLRARIGIHTGQPLASGSTYVGLDVHRASRICAAAHGGQIVISDASRVILEQALPEAVSLRDLGQHRLKDLQRPEALFQILHPALPEAFPPLRTLDAHKHNLPAQPTPFVGREEELRGAVALLRQDDVRLLAVTGPGGVGKTRFALQTAAELIDGFRDGAFFVTLVHLTDPHSVVPALAQALGVGETPGRTLIASLEEYLKPRQTLLVLDNLEQVMEATRYIRELLEVCPDLKMIATSRERLRLQWEREFPLSPLPVPTPAAADAAAFLRNPAVVLFVDRCRSVQPDFALSAENAAAIAEICARLEGLPLAIELAAARIKILTPQEIAHRLRDQLRLLTSGPRDAPYRHQSLHAAVSWSYELLTPAEQRLFRHLAVFRGGVALDSAETVCAGADVDVLDGLASLVDKSLLRRMASGGTTRIFMLETIREFGMERLAAAGELEQVRTHHAAHFADLAGQAEAALISPDEEAAMERLWRERENVRAALDWSLRRGDLTTAARLGSGLGWVLYLHGNLTEGRGQLEQVLRTAGGPSGTLRAGLLLASGILAWSVGDAQQAFALLEEAHVLWEAEGLRRQGAITQAFLGHAARSLGRGDEAARRYQAALEIWRSIGNERGIAWALFDLGLAARDRGEGQEALALHEQSLAVFRRVGYRWGMAWTTWNLGLLAHGRGDHDQARAHFVESLELYHARDDRRGIAQCLEGLAAVLFAWGQAGSSARVLSAADALREGLGVPLPGTDRGQHDRTLSGLRASLAPDVFEAEWRAGRALDVEAAIGLALETPPRAPTGRMQTPADPLTAREREVAVLIARGLTNRDIAAQLRVSERTAITHVEHIMNKLGMHTRAQIAAWAVRQGLDLPAPS
ncbi:MAG TPA: tetratricopeptide repeat protein [bacterium]|nr:tetratricopeptide repeat protein [bacterium]